MMFELLCRLVSGSAANAWVARDGGSELRVLQAIRRPVLAVASDARRVLDATDLALGRVHPNLLSVERRRELPGGQLAFVSGPVSGVTAASVLEQEGPVPLERALRWATQACGALEYLHAQGIVHGNLSPRNFHLSRGGSGRHGRLLDTSLLHYRGERSFPVSGVIVEPEYLSPERVLGQRGDVLSDIYGLGLFLFELVTGAQPFRRVSREERRQAHLKAEVPRLTGALEPANEVIQRCLAKEARERFGSAHEARRAMEGLLVRVA